MNLAYKFVLSQGKTVQGARAEYHECCIDFAGDFVDSPEGKRLGARLAWFDTPHNPNWKYHVAAEVNGVIHDLWHPEPLPVEDYLKHIGADAVEYPAEEIAEG